MSFVRSIAGADALPDQLARFTPPEPDQLVTLRLGNGWTALATIGPSRHDARSGLNGIALTPDHWRDWLNDPLQWVQQAQRQDLMKTSATTIVCRIRLPLGDGRYLEGVCKRGRPRYLRKRVLNVFRISRPMRTWRRAHDLLSRHIPTAQPLAVLERRRCGLLLDSLIITEFLHDAVDLESLLTTRMRGLSNSQAYRIKSRVCGALTAFLFRLHSAGLFHRDLKALNVIVQWKLRSREAPRICLVDLDGLKRSWLPRGRAWMRMLMRLNVSVDGFRRVHLTDRLRLLKRYLQRSGSTKPWKQVWRELAILSDRKREIRSRHQERTFRKYGRF